MGDEESAQIETLALRERWRDDYSRRRDPIAEDRLLWRAQTFRHLVHLLPGQTILELGCGEGGFTRALIHTSRAENPVTAVTFDAQATRPLGLPDGVEFVRASALPQALGGRRFNFIAAMDLLDQRNCAWLLQHIHDLLEPGGEVVLYESNPWNAVRRLRSSLSRLVGRRDPRQLLSRTRLYELLSDIGFIRAFAAYNDFVYAPLTPSTVWLFRNLSIMLENAPVVRTLAGSILLHAQRPPKAVARPKVSLCNHRELFGAVSVVIPCRNEEMNIGPLVEGLLDLYGDYIHEIIPVDDGSTDGTPLVLRKLAEADSRVKPLTRTPPNGVGFALRDGWRATTGRWVLSSDCDFQHLLPEFRDLFDAAAEGFDVAVGSRFSRHSVLLNYPFPKIVANRAFHALARLVLRRQFRDLTNNLKLMRREVVDDLVITQQGFAVNAESGLEPLLMGYRIKEVAISWINRSADMGSSSFHLVRVGGGYWHVLLQLWLNAVRGTGPYRGLSKRGDVRATLREGGAAPSPYG